MDDQRMPVGEAEETEERNTLAETSTKISAHWSDTNAVIKRISLALFFLIGRRNNGIRYYSRGCIAACQYD